VSLLGSLTVNWTGGVLAAALAAALFFTARQLTAQNLQPEPSLDGLIWVIPAGLVGAHLEIVANNWTYYSVHPLGIITPTISAGDGVLGAVIAGSAAALLFVRARRLPAGRYLDASSFGLALGLFVGAIGQLIAHEHWLPFASPLDPSTTSTAAIANVIWTAGLLALLLASARRPLPAGLRGWLSLLVVATGSAASTIVADRASLGPPLGIPTVAILFAAVCLGGIAATLVRVHRANRLTAY
jgi:prolipoprotein diacylglyceryltransferase